MWTDTLYSAIVPPKSESTIARENTSLNAAAKNIIAIIVMIIRILIMIMIIHILMIIMIILILIIIMIILILIIAILITTIFILVIFAIVLQLCCSVLQRVVVCVAVCVAYSYSYHDNSCSHYYCYRSS